MENNRPSIRFGVICGSQSILAWQLESLNTAMAIDGVEMALLITCSGKNVTTPAMSTGGSLWAAAQKRIASNLPCLAAKSIADFAPSATRISCQLKACPDGAFAFTAEDMTELASHDLDFVISLHRQRPSGEIQRITRQGVWYFQFGESRYGDGPIGFWEIYYGVPISRIFLLRPGVDGAPTRVLRGARLRTIDASYEANMERLVAESARWLAQACRDLLNRVDNSISLPEIDTTDSRSGMPSNTQYALFTVRIKLNKIRNILSHLFVHRHWGVAISFSPAQDLWLKPESVKAAKLPAPSRETFHADPFGMNYKNGIAVLYEQWNRTRGMGEIAGSILDGDSLRALSENFYNQPQSIRWQPENFETNLKFSHHCSYPYLFTHDDTQYCIPETGEGRVISLYRCTKQPGDWEHVLNIEEGFAAVDSTVVHHDGRWWLFCSNLDDNPNSHLYLWYADELDGNWQAHANNPVKMDICGARPAGTPFEHNGSLYRPTQNNSRNYGGGITIQKVNQISPTAFAEDSCGDLDRFTKLFGVEGMHTLSRIGNYTLLDYYRHAFLPTVFAYRARQYWQSKRQG